VWTKTGYSDLNDLGRALEKHNKSKEHIAFACKLFLFFFVFLEKFRIAYGKIVKLSSLIYIAIFLCQQELSFIFHNKPNA
jgi:hypothetical protein